jgi:hypothetical protein
MILVLSAIFPKRIVGITLWPFIFIKNRKLINNKELVNHERIHLRQQVELLVLPFYLWYTAEYIVRLILYRNAKKAYRNICFEREAYANEKDTSYLKTRKFWNFLRYIKNL